MTSFIKIFLLAFVCSLIISNPFAGIMQKKFAYATELNNRLGDFVRNLKHMQKKIKTIELTAQPQIDTIVSRVQMDHLEVSSKNDENGSEGHSRI